MLVTVTLIYQPQFTMIQISQLGPPMKVSLREAFLYMSHLSLRPDSLWGTMIGSSLVIMLIVLQSPCCLLINTIILEDQWILGAAANQVQK